MAIYLGVRAVVMLVGLIMYLLFTRAEGKEIGRIMFFAGLFTLLLTNFR